MLNKTELENGITVISESLPYLKSFSLGFWFNVGSRDEKKYNNGITHFIEHMVFKGTAKRSAKRIADDIEGYGGYLNAFTSKEHTCYYGRGLEENFERTFDVISDMIQNPLFKASDLKKESSVILDEMSDINDNPEELIFDKFEEYLFKGNSLSLPIIGEEETLLKINSDDLFEYMEDKYSFDNMVIGAAGAVDHQKMLDLVDKYFKKDLGKKSKKRNYFKHASLVNKEIEKPIQQVHLIIGTPTYGYKDKERIAVNILSNLLGEGSSSRLFQNIREKKGIAYQINSFINSFYDVSTFGVYLSTNVNQSQKAEELVYKELQKMNEKEVPVKELNRIKEYVKGNLILSLESMTSRMFRMASSQIYYKRIIEPDEMIKMIDEVTTEEIYNLSKTLLNESSLTKIVLKPDKSVKL